MSDRLTAGLALYGAILSTVIFLWSLYQSRRRVTVRLVYGSTSDGEDGVFIFVQNPSAMPVHVSSIGILYPYENPGALRRIGDALRYRGSPFRVGWVHSSLTFYQIDTRLPVSLEPGQSHQVFLPDAVVDRIMEKCVDRRLRAVAQDQLWKDSFSEVLYIHPR